ncbi:MAG: hypothetical protein JSR21_07020 [Proteobacteria bacterium]|nr:hypothetical protein [Pseudomonadota bacterium]
MTVSATRPRRPAGPVALRLAAIAAAGLLCACSTETLFQSNFDQSSVGQPPAATQAVGTATTFGAPGSVVVTDPPPGSSNHWLQVSRASLPNNTADIAGFVGKLSKVPGAGKYTFICAVYLPNGKYRATFQFEPALQPGNGVIDFLHIDLTEDNKVRVDDNDATKFGSFQRNTPFDLIVGIDTTVAPAMAHISIIGSGASGSLDYPIQAGLQNFAKQFGALRVWMGFPWTGSFQATQLLVTHNTN